MKPQHDVSSCTVRPKGSLLFRIALTPEQLQRIADLRAFAAKKEKVAQLLIAEGLEDEATPHQEAAGNALDKAHRIETIHDNDEIPF